MIVVIGNHYWGVGKTLEKAKAQFRREGGRLSLGYTVLDFGTDLEFTGVDQLGRVYWEGDGRPVETEVKPRKKSFVKPCTTAARPDILGLSARTSDSVTKGSDMTIISWTELRDRALKLDYDAVGHVVHSLEEVAREHPEVIDLENAEWDAGHDVNPNPTEVGEALRMLGEEREAHQVTKDDREQWRSRAISNASDYSNLLEAITERLKEAVDGEGLDLELAKTIAVDLGAKAPSRTFDVTIDIQVTIEGLEAEDEEDADKLAREAVSIDVSPENEYSDENSDITSVDVTETS